MMSWSSKIGGRRIATVEHTVKDKFKAVKFLKRWQAPNSYSSAAPPGLQKASCSTSSQEFPVTQSSGTVSNHEKIKVEGMHA